MAFTIEVNGTEYTEAHFTPALYHLNFPMFLRDCTEHLANSLTSYARTYGSNSFSPATVSVAPGKALYVGMPILFYNTGRTSIYYCTVTTYNSTTGAMTCSVQHSFIPENVQERSDWWCVAGNRANLIASNYTGLTSTGQTTIAGIKNGCGQGSPSTRLAEHFEDFLGKVPTVEAGGLSETASSNDYPGVSFAVAGTGRIAGNLNQNQMFCSGNCPGVIELAVTNSPDSASVVGRGVVTAAEGHYATFRVLIPDSVEGEEVEVHIGCSDSVIVSYSEQTLYAAYLSFNSLSTPIKGKKLIEARYTTGLDGFEQGLGAKYSKNDIWEQGRWLAVNFTKLGSGLYSATVSDDNGVSVYTPAFPVTPTAGTIFSGAYPFVLLKKKRGSKESKIYVDYLGSGNPSITR